MSNLVRSKLTGRTSNRVAWLAACLVFGCTGEIAGNGSGASGSAAMTAAGGSVATGGAPQVAPACDASTPPARRVTLRSELHFTAALRDLFGATLLDGVSGVPDARSRTLDLDLVNQMTAKSLSTRFEQVEAVGAKLAEAPASLACLEGEAPRNCALRIAGSVAEEAFRRPVQAREIDDLMQVYDDGAAVNHATGMRALAEAISFAPSATYTRELGTEKEPGKFALSSWEVADILALFLLESIPDAPLLAAARADLLQDDAAIDAQVTRLLGQDGVRKNLSQTLLSFLQAPRIFDTVKDPKFGDFTSLKSAMFNETSLLVDELLWRKPAPMTELLTTTRGFVNPALAALYGVTYPGTPSQSDFLAVDLPPEQRAGILTQAGLLSIKAAPNTTSIIFRGLFVRGTLLCLPDLPLPTDAATQSKINDLASNATLSEREKAEVRRTTSPCSGCHAQFDPFGLALENYDAIGRYRADYESGAPIDGSIDLTPFVPALNGKVRSAVELAKQVAASGRFQACLGSRIMSYAVSAPLSATDCDVQAVLTRARATGDTVAELARAIATSPLLRTRSAAAAGASP